MNPSNSDENNTPPVDGTTPDTPTSPDTNPPVEPTPVANESETPEAPSATPAVDAPVPEDTATTSTQSPFFAESTPSTPNEPTQTTTPQPGQDPAATPTPVAGAPSTAATAGVVAGAAGDPQKPNSKKPLLIGSIVAGIIILAIIGIVAFLAFTTVSKDDYRAATVQFNDVSAASSDLNFKVTSLSSSINDTDDAEFNDNVKQTEEAIASIKTENEELGKLKAVRVGEGAELYKTFDDKVEAYLKNGSELVTSVKNLRPATAVCAKVSDAVDAAARSTALKACSEAVNNVGELPNAQFNKFVTELKGAYSSYATVYEKMSALTNPFGAQYEEYKTLRDQLAEAQKKLVSASKTFATDISKRDDELSPKDASKALGTYLTEQQK